MHPCVRSPRCPTRHPWSWIGLLAATLLAGTPGSTNSARAATPDFTRDVRPLLSDNCFACHGPDEKKRKAKYRVDTKAGAFASADGAAVILPGKALESPFYQRLVTHDEDELMPPSKTGKKLSEKQIALLRDWINAGAKWDEHWAFIPPEQPQVPAVRHKDWARNPVDHFVAHRLEAEGLEPSAEADRTTLLRRVTFDLTGLPPTVDEIDSFLQDSNPRAYEKVVDRLLDSSRYGEHMARYWMDAVRYADTHGYHIDSQRDIWAYRQWVIEAFNRNLPFDQFTLEQLAGDLLPAPTRDQRVATGFVRCNMSTGEGGAIEEEYRAKYAFDRVETLGTVWLGVTLICSRCHSHKYDPLPNSEYYGLVSFFNNLDEPIMDGNRPNPDPYLKLPSPEQTQRLDTLKSLVADAERKLEAPHEALDSAQPQWIARWHQRLRDQLTLLTPTKASASRSGGLDLTIQGDGTVRATDGADLKAVYETTFTPAPGRLTALRLDILPEDDGDPHPGRTGDRWSISEIEAELAPPPGGKPDAKPRPLKFARAFASSQADGRGVDLAIDGKPDSRWEPAPGLAQGTLTSAFLVLQEATEVSAGSEIRVRLRQESPGTRASLPRFRMLAAQQPELAQILFPPKSDPWRVLGPLPADNPANAFQSTHPAESALDFDAAYAGVRTEARWRHQPELEDGRNNLLVADLHGIHGVRLFHRKLHASEPRETEMSLTTEAWVRIWLNGRLVAERAREARPGEGPILARLPLKAGDNEILIKLVSIQGATYFQFNPDRNARENLTPDIAGTLAVTQNPSGDAARNVRRFYRRQQSPDFRKLGDDLASMRDESTRIERSIPTTLVARELPNPRETFILLRGEYDKPGPKVGPAVFSSLAPFPSHTPTNRLGLARWLTDPRQPLTARVTVNRFWSQYFGAGIVRTTDDFGSQGDHPSHPDLLDWMATEFVRTGWDVKRLQKLIVTSATYRQSSKAPPTLRARDPENRLLARGPRFRLDGEVVRDTCLSLAGMLSEKIGGPSARPYEPPGLWEAVSFNNSQRYVQDRGESQYRRSLYTFWKRQSPPPNMLLLDAPTRETCTVRRPRTNTPLQALATLNDPQFVEAARGFAHRLLKHPAPDASGRLQFAFRTATGRNASPDELRVLGEILDKSLNEFLADANATSAFLGIGDLRCDPALKPAELAAWSTVASLLLNLDEVLTKN